MERHKQFYYDEVLVLKKPEHPGDDYRVIDRYVDLECFRAHPGEVYEVRTAFATKGGERYDKGDLLVVLERTNDMPYGWLCTAGNLRVRGKNGEVTVWSTFESGIKSGNFRRLPVITAI